MYCRIIRSSKEGRISFEDNSRESGIDDQPDINERIKEITDMDIKKITQDLALDFALRDQIEEIKEKIYG